MSRAHSRHVFAWRGNVSAALELFTLGGLSLKLGGEAVSGLASRKAEALLVYLASTQRPHSRDALADLLWDERSQAQAQNNLRVLLSSLRQRLGPHLLITRQTVALNLEAAHWLDAAEMQAHLAAVRQYGASRDAAVHLEQAVSLYRGDFLEGVFWRDCQRFEEWVVVERERLQRLVLEALEALAVFHLHRQEYDRGIAHATRLLALDPLRESAHRQMMRLLARQGQRGAALAQYETCRQTLADELGLEPAVETTALYQRLWAARTGPAHNLPLQFTPLVGRAEELAAISEHLDDPACRLVTLIGPGGIGKTRLAAQAARLAAEERADAFPDGAGYVSLTAVSSPDSVAPAVAQTLALSLHDHDEPETQLLNFVRDKAMLLVLDNFEHLLPAAPLIVEMLRVSPGLKVLVTSRQPLRLRAEWLMEIQGLASPREGEAPRPEAHVALQLFELVARRVQPHFSLEAEQAAVARICRLVEGMPLGIELAAVRRRELSSQEIARQIENNLDALATSMPDMPERHRSLRAVFDYSWQRLAKAERRAFAGLSIFRGGFSEAAAQAVTGAAPTVLAALITHSLLREMRPGRYAVHEVLRQYAEEKLRASLAEAERAEREHGRYYLAFLHSRGAALQGPHQKEALADIDVDLENARAAWRRALTREMASDIEQSVDTLYRFYEARGQLHEGLEALTQTTEAFSGSPTGERAFGKALARLGALRGRVGQYAAAAEALRRSLALSERRSIQAEQIFCLIELARVAHDQGHYAETVRLIQQCLSLAGDRADDGSRSDALFLLGYARYRMGELEEAKQRLEDSLAAARRTGEPHRITAALNLLADVASFEGRYAHALELFTECLTVSRAIGNLFRAGVHLNNLGTVWHVMGQLAQARDLYQQSLEACRQIGNLYGQAIALSNLGEVSHALGDYAEALAAYQAGLAIGRRLQSPYTTLICLNNLGETYCARRDYPTAQSHLAEALQIAWDTRNLPVLMKMLVNQAALFRQTGQTQAALELLRLTSAHPAAEPYIVDRAKELLAEAGPAPTGAPRPLDEIVAGLLAALTPQN